MANDEHLKILEKGVTAWNEWRTTQGAHLTPDLVNANLSGADLNGINLARANLVNANLTGADLFRANLAAADLTAAGLSEANLREANLEEAILTEASLREAILWGANLGGADLRGTLLELAILVRANLSGVKVDARTEFCNEECDVEVVGCSIDKYALRTLDNYGGLTSAHRAVMIIKDDLADLRASYSGLQRWIHLLALLAFVLPYAWFLAVQYGKAQFVELEGSETIALWEALLRFIWNGGKNWQAGWAFSWSFLAFIYLAIYNVGRGVLLWQTNRLEHQEHVTGVPVRFSLAIEPFWRRLVKTMNVLFWIGLGILLLNSYHFLTQQIPI